MGQHLIPRLTSVGQRDSPPSATTGKKDMESSDEDVAGGGGSGVGGRASSAGRRVMLCSEKGGKSFGRGVSSAKQMYLARVSQASGSRDL